MNIAFVMAGCRMQVASEDGAITYMDLLARDKHVPKDHLNGRQEVFSQAPDGMSSGVVCCHGETLLGKAVSQRSRCCFSSRHRTLRAQKQPDAIERRRSRERSLSGPVDVLAVGL